MEWRADRKERKDEAGVNNNNRNSQHHQQQDGENGGKKKRDIGNGCSLLDPIRVGPRERA